MAASAYALFSVERPGELFHALDLYLIRAAEGDELIVEVLLTQSGDRRLKLRRRVGAADEQHLEQAVVGDDLLPEEVERSGQRA